MLTSLCALHVECIIWLQVCRSSGFRIWMAVFSSKFSSCVENKEDEEKFGTANRTVNIFFLDKKWNIVCNEFFNKSSTCNFSYIQRSKDIVLKLISTHSIKYLTKLKGMNDIERINNDFFASHPLHFNLETRN
jgi:hypothetical protein